MDANKGFTPFQIILTGIFAFLAVLGLFIFATYQGFGGKKDAVGTVIIWGTLPTEAVQGGLDAVSSGRDEYADVTYVEQSAASFSKILSDALASGTGPDLVILSQEQLQSEKPKLSVIPFSVLPQRTYLDSYIPLFELFLTSGGTYGIPLAADPLVLYYNRSMLSSVGVVAPPSTWEAVAGLAPVISKRTDAGAITQSLIAFGDYVNVNNARAVLSLLLLQAGTPITVTGETGSRAVFAEEGETTYGATPAQSAASFYAQFADPAKTLYSWNRSLPDSRSLFLSGDLALYPGFASELPYLMEANPNLDFDMAAVPAPGNGGTRMTYGVGYAFAIPKAAVNGDGAYLVAMALADPAIAPDVARNLSMAPALRSALSVEDDDRFGAVYLPQALVAKGWLSPAPGVVDAAFSAMIGDITSGRRDLDDALSNAASTITAALR